MPKLPKQSHREDMLDEALDESYPASDPVSLGHTDHAGRPGDHGGAVNAEFSTPVLAALDRWVEDQRRPLSRAEAVRGILAEFLRSQGYLGKL